LRDFEEALVDGNRAPARLLLFGPARPRARAIGLKGLSYLGPILEAQHDIEEPLVGRIGFVRLQRADAITRAGLAFRDEPLLLGFRHAPMQRLVKHGRAARIIRYLDPFGVRILDGWRRGALKALHAQPDWAISVGDIAFEAGQPDELVLMQNELRAVGELVL